MLTSGHAHVNCVTCGCNQARSSAGASSVSCRVSRVACLVSRVSCRVSRVACLVSRVSCLVSRVSCRVSRVACLVSRVAYLVSRAPRLVSHPQPRLRVTKLEGSLGYLRSGRYFVITTGVGTTIGDLRALYSGKT
ncbi:hypothetical protein RR46_03118 [Papilio xuthus]|uniref:Uncharacterized protein n=1 Tax=Papilio xuthus TaxID=66420 RepID=A0A194QD19_PAPXU|nr:hypothetical protein RR46_03118 [Papilio xuthus]